MSAAFSQAPPLYVLLDGYYMPRIAEVAAKLDIRTAPFSIIRLHGPDRAEIEKETGGTWNEIVEPKDDGLKATANIVRQNLEFGLDTYVNVNNHYEGSAEWHFHKRQVKDR